LIPIGYKSYKLLSKYIDEVSLYTDILISDRKKINICLNKMQTYELAKKIEVPVPKTYYPNSIKNVKENYIDIDYPLIIKGLFEMGTNVVELAKNHDDLYKRYKNLCDKYSFTKNELPMIQEYINEEPFTYGFGALYHNGECKNYFMHKEIRSYPITGGSGTCLISIYDNKLKYYGKKLLDELGWNGVALVEFKKKNNDYILMEINPKFWASIDLAIKAGVNFPVELCNLSNDTLHSSLNTSYKNNLKYNFPLSRELKHILKSPSSLLNVIKDTTNPNVENNIELHDFLPHIYTIIPFKKYLKRILNSFSNKTIP